MPKKIRVKKYVKNGKVIRPRQKMKSKKKNYWKYATFIIIGIVVFHYGWNLAIMYEKDNQKIKITFPNEYSEEELENKLLDVYQQRSETIYKLYFLNQVISIYEMELEAKQNNMSVKYIDVPNSSLIIRAEYNGSFIDNVEINYPEERERVK